MLSRASRPALPALLSIGLLSIGLGYAIFEDGGVDTWGWNTCLLVIGLVAAAYWVFTPARVLAPALGPWIGRALLLLPCYVLLQLIPLPFSLLKILSPARAQLVESLGAVMPRPEFASLSVAPTTTDSYLFRLVGYILVFLLVREITRRTSQEWPWTSFAPLVLVGALEAALGIAQSGQEGGSVGTYASKNHFAGLLEMILPATIAWGVTLVKEDAYRPPSLLRTLSGCAFFGAATAMFVAVLDSQSKMGFLAVLSGPLAMAALALGAGQSVRRKWVGAAGLVVILLVAIIFLPSNAVISGFGSASTDSTGEGRLPVAHDTLRLIGSYPVFGSGLGTFGSAFTKYQSTNGDVAFIDAHDDYLQLLAEFGLLGFAILGCWVIPVFLKAYRVATDEPDFDTRYIALGCIGGMVAIGVHSLGDFNLYLPANAMVLVWIGGIAAGLPEAFKSSNSAKARSSYFPKRPLLIPISCALVAFAATSLVFVSKAQHSANAERGFCRIGICDIDSVLAAETEVLAAPSKVASISTLTEALRRDPASPGRWSELGEAFNDAGKTELARRCYANALTLSSNIPPILLEAAEFYQKNGETNKALELASRALAQTQVYINPIFDWFELAKLPVSDIVSHGLPQDPSIYRTYLRHVQSARGFPDTTQVWNATRARGFVDDQIAMEYLRWVYDRKDYEYAAETWAGYLGDRAHGYLKSNRIFNGDFESEILPVPLDWNINKSDEIGVERDPQTKHSGNYSLRITLGGKENLSGIPVSQSAVVTPGRYHFEAYVKTQDLSTDQGISLHIADNASHLNWTTEPLLGTNDWRKFSTEFCVGPKTKLLTLNLVRQTSLKFDSLIKGTLWLDAISLAKLSPTCGN